MKRFLLPALGLAVCLGAVPTASAESPAGVVLGGADNGARDDRLLANSQRSNAGETARLLRKADGVWVEVAEKTLDEQGNARFVVEDLNRRQATRYKVRVRIEDPELRVQVSKAQVV